MLTRSFKMLAVALIAAASALAQPQLAAAPTAGSSLISARYLGFGSANTAVTTGAVALTNKSLRGRNIYALGCSGQFATSNWAAAVTDGAGNTYVQLGASSGTYPQANSTTQVCVPFLSVNAAPASTVTFTISGSNSANTTVSVMAWDIGNAIPTLASVDGWSGSGLSSVTAIAASVVVPSQANELAIAGGCMSTGTITLPTNSALTFDSGSQAIASGSNIVSCFGGNAVLGQPAGVIGSFTDGSSASGSVVVVLFRGYALTDAGLQHLSANMMQGSNIGNTGAYFGQAPAIVTAPPGWCKSQAAASGASASAQVLGVAGKTHIVTGFGYSMMADATGPAAAGIQTFSLTDNSSGNAISSYCSNIITTAGQPACSYSSGPIMFPVTAGASVTAAFGGNVAHELESVWLCGYDVSIPNIVY